MSTEDEVEGELPDEFEGVLTSPDEYDLSTQAQAFFWAVVDEYSTDEQTRHLESLITEHKEARQTFVECLHLHVGLIHYFHNERAGDSPVASRPILWPISLEPVMILVCPDREQREKEREELLKLGLGEELLDPNASE